MEAAENVTVLFTDLVSSTELATSVTPDASDRLRREHFAALRGAIATTGGTEVKNLGDGLMVVFRTASVALACAVAMQQAIDRDNRDRAEQLSIRVGVSCGEATREDGDYFGDPVVEAARLCARAAGGQILAADLVRATAGRRALTSFAAIGALELKGFHEPLETVEVLWEPLPEESGEPSGEVPLPARLAVPPFVGVIGRAQELDELAEAAKRVGTRGAREVVLVTGEPGQGKSTLVAELCRRVKEQGMTVLLGRCDEDLGAPYRPFQEALGHLVDHVPEAVLRAHVSEHGGELGLLVPGLRKRLGDLPHPRDTDPDTGRYLLFSAVAALLQQAAEERTVVLVLEDLHWADVPSLQLLRYLMSGATGSRLLIVGTYRGAELSSTHPLSGTVAALRREPGLSTVVLRGLGDDEVLTFMEAAAGHPLDDEGVLLAHALYEETDGNPFFVTEVLRHLAESGAIVRDETGRWSADGASETIALPDSVRQVVGARVARLGDAGVRTLSVAAVIGREFDLDLLAEVTGVEEDVLLDVLDAAGSADLVLEIPGATGRYSFSHALIQHTLYEDLGFTRRTRLHHRVAEALEDLCVAAPGERTAELAHHFLLATRPVDTDKAVGYAVQAAREALETLAPEDAVRHFEQALSLLDQNPDADARKRTEILVGLGQAQRQAGVPAFRETLIGAADEARRLGETSLLVAAALANNRGIAPAANDIDGQKVAVLEAALAAMPAEESTERATLLATLANELAYGPLDRRTALAEQAMAMARRAGDPATLVRVIRLVSGPRRIPSTLRTRVRDSAEALELAQQIGDPSQLYLAAQGRRNTAIENAEFGVADSCLQTMLELSERLQQPVLVWETTRHQAIDDLLRGDPTSAEVHSTAALELGLQIGEPDAYFSTFGLQFMQARLQQGRLGELLEEVAKIAVDNPSMPAYQAGLALACTEAGDTDRALDLLRSAAADGFASLPMDMGWMDGVAVFAQVAVELDVAGPALGLRELLEPFADQVVFDTLMPMEPVAWYLGGLCTLLERFDEADHHFERSEEVDRRGRRAYSLALNDLNWGRMLSRRGRAGDEERAAHLLGRARDTATMRGYATVERRATEARTQI